MPIYEFCCKKCGAQYEELTPNDPSGKYKKVKCPECKSAKKELMISMPSFNFANPVGTDRWNSDSGGHDYRFNHNAPNVREQREYAQKNSHVGPEPYNDIDDISSGEYFGEVK